MTDNNHPITPPDDLVEDWWEATQKEKPEKWVRHLATQAAHWGADMELEACCEWFFKNCGTPSSQLRAARRPKPPSLKEQALQALANADGADHPVVATVLTADQHALIRKALEQLND